MTAYNRVDYLQQVVQSWNDVRWLGSLEVHAYIEPSPVMNYITNTLTDLNTLVIPHFNKERQGVLINPWNALNNRFSAGTDFVVLAEDDVIVSQDAIEYIEWAAQTYAADDTVLAINLFSQIGGEKSNQVTRDGKFSPLVWGTWSNRWENHLRDSWDKDYTSGKEDGSEAGWDWNINRILAKTGMDIIKPLQSRSDHIGKYAGTHMTPDLFDSSRGVDFKQIRGRQAYLEI